jgi:hypothetical protein
VGLGSEERGENDGQMIPRLPSMVIIIKTIKRRKIMENQEEYLPRVVDLVPMNIGAVLGHVNLVQQIMKNVMQENEHYGIIPGTKKPTLYKSGAEKLNMTFRLTPKYDVHVNELRNGHRDYEVVCNLYSMGSDIFLGSGIGECTTMESKYRYRT